MENNTSFAACAAQYVLFSITGLFIRRLCSSVCTVFHDRVLHSSYLAHKHDEDPINGSSKSHLFEYSNDMIIAHPGLKSSHFRTLLVVQPQNLHPKSTGIVENSKTLQRRIFWWKVREKMYHLSASLLSSTCRTHRSAQSKITERLSAAVRPARTTWS